MSRKLIRCCNIGVYVDFIRIDMLNFLFNSRRWLEILLIAGLTYSFFDILTPIVLVSTSFNTWSDFYIGLSNINQGVIIFITGLIINQILLLSGDYNEKHEYQGHFQRLLYPPIRYAIALLIIIYSCLYFPKVLSATAPREYLNLLALCLGLTFRALFQLLLNKIESKLSEKKQSKIKVNKPERSKFLDWLLSEEPIVDIEGDRFNRGPIVSRIVDRLKKPDLKTLRGQTILADFGSGKSSVTKMIEDELLKDNSNWIVCRFDSWGRISSGEQGQKLILEKIIEEMGFYVGTSSVKSIPKDYLNALNGLGSWWKNTMAILYKTDLSPNVQLDKIDSVLDAIDRKLLIFIEDIDRNSDSEKLANGISPLLDRMVGVSNIQFIFTVGYEKHVSSVITRITNYREDLLISDDLVSKLLSDFRGLCLCPDNNIIYFDGAVYIDNWPLRDGIFIKSEQYSTMVRTRSKLAYSAVKYYLGNPRTTKYILRNFYESWSRGLAGEVNFDDLLMINIMKIREPSVYDFIILNIELLNKHSKNETEVKKLESNWLEIVDKVVSINHASSIVKYIFSFDLLDIDNSRNLSISSDYHCKQQISSLSGRNKYFDLIVGNYIPGDYVREQRFIEDMYDISMSLDDDIQQWDLTKFLLKHEYMLDLKNTDTTIRLLGAIDDKFKCKASAFIAAHLRDKSIGLCWNDHSWLAFNDLMEFTIANSNIKEDRADYLKRILEFIVTPFMVDNIQELITINATLRKHINGDDLLIINKHLIDLYFTVNESNNVVVDEAVEEFINQLLNGLDDFVTAIKFVTKNPNEDMDFKIFILYRFMTKAKKVNQGSFEMKDFLTENGILSAVENLISNAKNMQSPRDFIPDVIDKIQGMISIENYNQKIVN